MKVYDDNIIALMMDVEMRIKDHTAKYNAAMKKNVEKEHIWNQIYEQGCLKGLDEAMKIIKRYDVEG